MTFTTNLRLVQKNQHLMKVNATLNSTLINSLIDENEIPKDFMPLNPRSIDELCTSFLRQNYSETDENLRLISAILFSEVKKLLSRQPTKDELKILLSNLNNELIKRLLNCDESSTLVSKVKRKLMDKFYYKAKKPIKKKITPYIQCPSKISTTKKEDKETWTSDLIKFVDVGTSPPPFDFNSSKKKFAEG